MSDNHEIIKFGEFEDCYTAIIPKKAKEHRLQRATSPLDEVYGSLCMIIDELSQEVLVGKFKKLSNQLLAWIEYECLQLGILQKQLGNRQLSIDIKFTFLAVDQANQNQVGEFYKNLQEDRQKHPVLKLDCIEFSDFAIKESIIFHQKDVRTAIEADKAQVVGELLNFIVAQLKVQFSSKADCHTTVIMIQGLYNIEIGLLQELRKILLEEIKYRETRVVSKILIIFTASEQMVDNYQANGVVNKSYRFSEAEKMFIEMILKIFQNPSLPLLDFNLYTELYQEFQLYFTCYQDQINKIKAGCFLYFCNKLPNSSIENYKNVLVENNLASCSLQFRNLHHIRSQVSVFIEALQRFFKDIKKVLNGKKLNIKKLLFKLILNASNQQTQLLIPNEVPEEQLLKLFDKFQHEQKIREILQKAGVFPYNLFATEQSISKKDRWSQLSGLTKSRHSILQDNFNQLIHRFISKPIQNIQTLYREYAMLSQESFQDATNPDILGRYFEHFKDNQKGSRMNYNTVELIRNIKRGGINFPITELKKYVSDSQELLYSIGELKILGLIEDTKKMKPTYQRAFYAKSYYKILLGD